jgi:hypothetical protein
VREIFNGTRRLKSILSVISSAVFFFILVILMSSNVAQASQASSGELIWYPCTGCHPVGGVRQGVPLGKHTIQLEGHDKLGGSQNPCLVCHDSPTRNPGFLKLADGSLISINEDVSQTCYQCHSAKYKEWKEGAHGEAPLEIGGEPPKCTTSGCHDPHTPGWIAIKPLPPFLNKAIQVKINPYKTITPLPPPAPNPPSPSLPQLGIAATLAFLVIAVAMGIPIVLKRR